MNKRILPIAIISLLIFSVALGDITPQSWNILENHPKILGFDTGGYIFIALIITLPIELMVAWVLQKFNLKDFNLKRLLESVSVVNLMTVPIINMVVGYLSIEAMSNEVISKEFIIFLTILEAIVILFEAYFIYYNNKESIMLKDAIMLSIAMNSASFFGGLAIIAMLV